MTPQRMSGGLIVNVEQYIGNPILTVIFAVHFRGCELGSHAGSNTEHPPCPVAAQNLRIATCSASLSCRKCLYWPFV